jgi:hypothetical protein
MIPQLPPPTEAFVPSFPKLHLLETIESNNSFVQALHLCLRSNFIRYLVWMSPYFYSDDLQDELPKHGTPAPKLILCAAWTFMAKVAMSSPSSPTPDLDLTKFCKDVWNPSSSSSHTAEALFLGVLEFVDMPHETTADWNIEKPYMFVRVTGKDAILRSEMHVPVEQPNRRTTAIYRRLSDHAAIYELEKYQ